MGFLAGAERGIAVVMPEGETMDRRELPPRNVTG